MFQIIILSILIAFLSIIIMRGYDKFNNKQYERSDYIRQFILSLFTSVTVLFIDNHFSNYNKNQTGGNIAGLGFKEIHNNTKPNVINSNGSGSKSFIDASINKLKMNFDTGIPNF